MINWQPHSLTVTAFIQPVPSANQPITNNKEQIEQYLDKNISSNMSSNLSTKRDDLNLDIGNSRNLNSSIRDSNDDESSSHYSITSITHGDDDDDEHFNNTLTLKKQASINDSTAIQQNNMSDSRHDGATYLFIFH